MKEGPIRNQWSSRLGFVLATTGAAVGVGNIWKFPYMAGANGGSAFVLIYIIAIVLIGLPVMLAEMLIGHRGQHNQVDSMKNLAAEAGASKAWQSVGWLGIVTLLLTFSFYSVISGWSLAYFFKNISGELNNLSAAKVDIKWQAFLASPGQLIFWHTVFCGLTVWIVERGVQRGLEQASRLMMPILFLVLILLDIYGATTAGFGEAFRFLFDVKLSHINGKVIIDAMGHAFFTLAVGAGAMLVYASYLPKGERMYSPIITIAGLDVLVALLSGMAIFPIVFTYGLTPEAGPGLIFEVLPIAFAKMTGGVWVGSLFYLLFIFAAWTSSISMAEPITVMLAERYFGRRLYAAILVGVIAWVIGIGSCLSFNVWSDFTLFGDRNFFALVTDLVTNILLPIGGMAFAIFAGWKIKKQIAQEELRMPSEWLFNTWHFLTRYVAPIGILVVFVSALLG